MTAFFESIEDTMQTVSRMVCNADRASRKSPGPGRLGLFLLAGLLAACGGGDEYQIDLMPAPAVYEGGVLNPLAGDPGTEVDDGKGIFYATLREPAAPGSDGAPYRDERGEVLRLGVGQVELVDGPADWQELMRITLAKDREGKFRLRLADTTEIGILGDSITDFVDAGPVSPDRSAPGRRFAGMINEELRRSTRKDILIYIHGYKVPFPDPLLVSAELWHFLGYEGVAVAFSWPSTPSRWAYFKDLDTAQVSAFGFRKFLQFLARETDVERIHIIGYSAGSRLVARTTFELSLMNMGLDSAAARKRTRLGQVVLVGGDIDRDLFATYLAGGLLDSVEGLSVYMSATDSALGFSRFLLTNSRLGQSFDEAMPPATVRYLLAAENLHFINVTEAEGAASGNGHGYFRNSPWASSDILTMLQYDLGPAKRGLVRTGGSPIWTFPPDYVARLREAVIETEEAAR